MNKLRACVIVYALLCVCIALCMHCFVCGVLYVTAMLFYEGVIESEKEPCSLNHCRTNTSPCVAKHCWFWMKAALASVTPSFMAK